MLQNETMASNPTAKPKRAVSLYYMVKLHIDSGEYMHMIVNGDGVLMLGYVMQRGVTKGKEGKDTTRRRGRKDGEEY